MMRNAVINVEKGKLTACFQNGTASMEISVEVHEKDTN